MAVSKTPVKDFVDARIALLTGKGKRFVDRAHYERARDKAANEYHINTKILANPDEHVFTLVYSQVLGSLMNLSHQEFLTFRRCIDDKGKKPDAFENPYAGRLQPGPLDFAVNQIIANTSPDKIKEPPKHRDPLGSPKAQSPKKEDKPKATSPEVKKIAKTVKSVDRRPPPSKPVATKLEIPAQEEPHFTSRHVEMDDKDIFKIAFQNMSGSALLAQAREKYPDFVDFLEDARKRAEISQNRFAQALNITRAAYEKFPNKKWVIIPLEVMNQLADKLGADNEDEKVEWRKYMLGTPAEVNQDMVNRCFEEGVHSRNESGEHKIATGGYGYTHTIALAKFFKLLIDRHGLTNRAQLAQAIAQNAGLGDAVTKQLANALRNLAGSTENEAVDTTTLSAERLSQLNSEDNRVRKMSADLAAHVAEFAFPDDMTARKECMEFLTSDKYKIPDEIISQNKSDMMTRVRKERGSNWGSRSNKPREFYSTP